MIAEFHFLRPLWLLALLPLGWLLWRLLRVAHSTSAWQRIVDPALQGQLLDPEQASPTRWPLAGVALLWVLSAIALAGPTWEQRKAPLYRSLSERILVLDLSASMNAGDVRPSRVQRAVQKLSDVLDRSGEAQTALVVFSAVAYVVTPLTDDVQTIRSMLPALTTDLVPVQGSRPALALLKAMRLLDSAGSAGGSIWLLTDGSADAESLAAASQIIGRGYSLSVLALATREGAPIPDGQGGFVKDGDGNIVVPDLDESSLRELAAAGRGTFAAVAPDESDIEQLLRFESRQLPRGETSGTQQHTEQWIERGPWLLLLILPFSAVLFRRGWL